MEYETISAHIQGIKNMKQISVEYKALSIVIYIYIPRDNKLRIKVIQLHYDILVEKYENQWKMIELVTWNFWWLEVTKKVKQYNSRLHHEATIEQDI